MSCADTYLTQNMIAGCFPEIEFLDIKIILRTAGLM